VASDTKIAKRLGKFLIGVPRHHDEPQNSGL